MSIWSGIKYALNSTLGTDEFKPLDQQLQDMMGLIADDTALYTIKNFSSFNGGASLTDGASNTYMSDENLAIKTQGTMYLKLSAKFDLENVSGNYYVTYSGYLNLYKNGSLISQTQISADEISANGGRTDVSVSDTSRLISLTKDDKITASIQLEAGYYGYLETKNIRFTAEIYAKPVLVGSNLLTIQ